MPAPGALQLCLVALLAGTVACSPARRRPSEFPDWPPPAGRADVGPPGVPAVVDATPGGQDGGDATGTVPWHCRFLAPLPGAHVPRGIVDFHVWISPEAWEGQGFVASLTAPQEDGLIYLLEFQSEPPTMRATLRLDPGAVTVRFAAKKGDEPLVRCTVELRVR